MTDIHIRRASANEVVHLRHSVLRAGLPRHTAIFPGDDEPTAQHFVAEHQAEIIGCVTLHLNEWQSDPAWQLRGMAVADGFRNRGVGSKLLAAIEQSVRENPPPLLWCNARVPASRFYQNHGWQITSDVFDIPTAGPHVKMIKRIAPAVR